MNHPKLEVSNSENIMGMGIGLFYNGTFALELSVQQCVRQGEEDL